MNTKDAVEQVLKHKTKYGLGKSLGMSASSVYQWCAGTKMSVKTAAKFTELYGIEIDDTYDPPGSLSN